ncbi:MAG: hypothetical protein MR419_05415 [Clostridiales bacterium]|nr:hypothetical protein [Clostridiales bacterium]
MAMIQRQEIVDVATAFAGRALTAGEEEVLSSLCGGALDQWRGRLRDEVDEEDCRDLLVVASAWTALAAMTGAMEASQPTPVSFSAGDLSVTAARGEGGNACAESLRRQAELVMTPYVQDGAFAFLEVEG